MTVMVPSDYMWITNRLLVHLKKKGGFCTLFLGEKQLASKGKLNRH